MEGTSANLEIECPCELEVFAARWIECETVYRLTVRVNSTVEGVNQIPSTDHLPTWSQDFIVCSTLLG